MVFAFSRPQAGLRPARTRPKTAAVGDSVRTQNYPSKTYIVVFFLPFISSINRFPILDSRSATRDSKKISRKLGNAIAIIGHTLSVAFIGWLINY